MSIKLFSRQKIKQKKALITRIPSKRERARSGRSARRVRMALNAGMSATPTRDAKLPSRETFYYFRKSFFKSKNYQPK